MTAAPLSPEFIGASRTLFLALLSAHLLADFLLQSDDDVKFKRRPLRLVKHVGIVTGVSYLLVGAWAAWWIPLAVAVSHGLIDRLKLLAEDLKWTGRIPFLLDQAAHLGVVAALAWAMPADWIPAVFWADLIGPVFVQGCLIACGAIIAVNAGGYIIGMSVQPYLNEVLTQTADNSLGDGLAKGGMIIGQLERALIYFFVLIGQPGAVGFLIAAKSVFRFGELSKSRKEAEYILIGTLMSFGWGLLAAWGTGWLGRHWGLF